MYERFTDRARKVMQLANQEAQRFNHEYIGTEHILSGLVKEGSGVAANVLKNLDIDLRKIRLEVEKTVQPGPDMVAMGKRPQTPKAKKVIEYAIEEARNLNHNYVGTEHLLLGLLREGDNVGSQILLNLGLKLEAVREKVLSMLGQSPVSPCEVGKLLDPFLPPPADKPKPNPQPSETKTPNLDQFGCDLTALARHKKLDPFVGRAAEIERVLLVLGCRTQNVPLLVGPLGAGKSAVVRGLALAAVTDDAPKILRDRRVVVLNLARMILLTRDRGDLLTKGIQAVAEECRRLQHVLLYLDDVFTFGSSGKVLLSAFLAEGVPCLLTATPEKYPSLADDPSVGRHCQKIPVEPLTREKTVEVLRTLRPRLHEHHQVNIGDDALSAAVESAYQHVTEGCLPGKALRVLGQACTLVRMANEPRQPEVRELDSQIELLTFEKEAAAAAMNFEKAAAARDRADKLKQIKESVLRLWHENYPEQFGTVDAAAVRQVVEKMQFIPSPLAGEG